MKSYSIILLLLITIGYTSSCKNSSGGGRSDIDSSTLVQKYLKDHLSSKGGFKAASASAKNDTTTGGATFEKNVLPEIISFLKYNPFFAGVDSPISIRNYSLAVDTIRANRYIDTFLHNSLQGTIKSFMFRADTLQNYLTYAASVSKDTIVNFRFMFGTFIDSVKKTPVLTFIVAGLDRNNKYVLYKNNTVFEHCLPCPDNCPVDMITQQTVSDIIKR